LASGLHFRRRPAPVNTSIRRATGSVSTSSPGIIATPSPRDHEGLSLRYQLSRGKVGSEQRLRQFGKAVGFILRTVAWKACTT
jgi:hypothetical protein